MMDQHLAEEFAQWFKIAVEHVVREEYEMLLLRGLFESRLGSNLVFKGGTAGSSPRNSAGISPRI